MYLCFDNQKIELMKPYAAVIVFLTLVLSSVLTSLNSYNRTKATIVNDMNHALALTLSPTAGSMDNARYYYELSAKPKD